jgi:hypothetical protein
MKANFKLSRMLFAPLLHATALLLLLEEWLWDLGGRSMARLAAWPPLNAVEARVQALPPYGALIVFALPGILLLPVKILGVIAIARGHAAWGVGVIVLAKLGGATVVARLYALTEARLLTLPWFERWHGRVTDLQQRLTASLIETGAWRRLRAIADSLRGRCRAQPAGADASQEFGRRAGFRPARVLRHFIALWRARHGH